MEQTTIAEGRFSDLTLIVISDERHPFLRRSFEYYGGEPIRVVVADSSREPYDLGPIPENIHYLHYPGYPFAEKMVAVLEDVQTEYVNICGCDDFLFLDAARICRDFLRSNPSYSSAQGRYVHFSNSGSFNFHMLYPHAIDFRIDSDSASVRLGECLGHYVQQFYSVHFTEVLRTVFRRSLPLKNGRFGEVLVAAIAAIKGRHAVLPVFYGAREILPRYDGKYFVENVELVQNAVFMAEHQGELQNFSHQIIEELMENGAISHEDAIRATADAIMRFVSFQIGEYESQGWNTLAGVRKHVVNRWRCRPGNSLSENEAGEAFDRLAREGDPVHDPAARRELERIANLVWKHGIELR